MESGGIHAVVCLVVGRDCSHVDEDTIASYERRLLATMDTLSRRKRRIIVLTRQLAQRQQSTAVRGLLGGCFRMQHHQPTDRVCVCVFVCVFVCVCVLARMHVPVM